MSNRKVFVGSLPNGVTDEMLQAEFSQYGQVMEIFVKPGCESGRQWAFVTFATNEQAQYVKETCDRVLVFPGHDRPCDVMIAKNQGMHGKEAAEPAPGYHQPVADGYGAMVGAASGGAAKKVFVGSLPDGITDGILRSEFSKYGQVEDIFIKPGCESGRQWSFVNFASAEQAAYAAEMANGVLHFTGCDKPCEVTLARNQGMFGQDPLAAAGTTTYDSYDSYGGAYGAPAAASYAPAGGGMSEAQIAPRKIFVGSLPDSISDPSLRAEFSKYGQITDIYMKTHCEPGRQWAFITFQTSEQAQFARNSCDRSLMFPGAEKPCEVTMARHQGMFGKDSIEQPAAQGTHGAAPQAAVEGPKKVFVGSLPDSITDQALRSEFSKYGQIVDLYLKTTCESGRQWAFITFMSHEQAQFAKDATDRVLSFPGSEKACEVMLAKNQGKFGQAPLTTYNGPQHHGAAAQAADMAQPPPPATPPPAHLTPWRMYKTASGLPYYHNATTGVTQWECPPDFQVPGQPLYSAPPQAAYQSSSGGTRYVPY